MSNFKVFAEAVKLQVDKLSAKPILFEANTDKQELYSTYLNSFPEGENKLYRERLEYDCNCCKNFIRDVGNMVSIDDSLNIVTIWDVDVPYPYTSVAKALSDYVKSKTICDVFFHYQNKVGAQVTAEIKDGKTVGTWNHFYGFLTPQHVLVECGTKKGEYRSACGVFVRGCEELSLESIDTVLDLISQNSLYRGSEFKQTIETFKSLKIGYDKASNKNTYAWTVVTSPQRYASTIRNTAIGTLLIDLSEGRDLEEAVAAYEHIMAPANYRRPTALVTKTMIDKAEKEIVDLGLMTALSRRYAVMEDITINNVLFANRDSKKLLANVFDELKAETVVNPKTFDKVEEITIENFIANVLPRSTKIGVLFEKKHFPNMVSLIAPVDKTAGNLFKWDNNFSWTYKGDIADSMKERVKAAGGNVEGVLRFSIQWNEDGNSICDLDAHAYEPSGTHIYYSSEYRKDRGGYKTSMSGQLDVDMINPRGVGVENIVWSDLSKMKPGDYRLKIHNFNSARNSGFTAQVEFDGQIFEFSYSGNFQGTMDVATVNYSLRDGFKLTSNMPSTSLTPPSVEEWGIKTNQFVDVSVMMYSPNYWDGQAGIGNKHFFFMLEGCKSPDSARGFYNEFLRESLNPHRKTFEVLGSKLKAPATMEQLSGLGFSSTQKNSLIVKVEGALTRTLKITF